MAVRVPYLGRLPDIDGPMRHSDGLTMLSESHIKLSDSPIRYLEDHIRL